MSKSYYCDIREGEVLKLGKLELRVLLVNDNGSLLFRYRHFSFFMQPKTYQVHNGFGMYNYGKGSGRRVHLRIEVPQGMRYRIEKVRRAYEEPVE